MAEVASLKTKIATLEDEIRPKEAAARQELDENKITFSREMLISTNQKNELQARVSELEKKTATQANDKNELSLQLASVQQEKISLSKQSAELQDV